VRAVEILNQPTPRQSIELNVSEMESTNMLLKLFELETQHICPFPKTCVCEAAIKIRSESICETSTSTTSTKQTITNSTNNENSTTKSKIETITPIMKSRKRPFQESTNSPTQYPNQKRGKF